MNVNDLSPLEPLLPLLAFHRRAEKHLAQLAALATELRARRLAPDLCAAASTLLHALGDERSDHHAMEESRLLPSMERRIRDARALDEFRRMRHWIGEDHERVASAWRALRKPLQALAEGVPREIDPEAVAQLRTVYGRHIIDEETALHRFALRYLRMPLVA
jgi:hypothetical protein